MIEAQEKVEGHAVDFSRESALEARDRAWKVLEKIALAIEPGISEEAALSVARTIIDEDGFEKHWHKPIVRFGTDTLRGYSETFSNEILLQKEDIFFIDIGPVWKGYEADVGKAYVMGEDPGKRRCAEDVEILWKEMRNVWKGEGLSGKDLYEFGVNRAKEKGWVFKLDAANGHRLSEFPHHLYYKGNMTNLSWSPAPYLWMLEVQLAHPTRPFGAFYEDLLF